MQCWHMQIKTTLYRFCSCKNVSVRSRPTLHKYLSSAVLSQTCSDNIELTIFLCNAVPAWSIQHCIGYFSHKSCLFTMGQHCTGDFLVQLWPRKIRTPLKTIFLCKAVCGLFNDRWGNDRSTGGRQRFFLLLNSQGSFWSGSNVLECAYYLFCINRFT